MPVFGTAGHVDHGKSTLIQALTGRDPDRWEEEKARGLTIDLGFAWTELPSGIDLAFVDVPGHERFMKNMLAGIESIDAAILVVAADEGWMPQTEEHLAVLDLLDVRDGVVVVSKSDLVDDDLLELAQLEIAEQLTGTRWESAPMIAVSAKTGDGKDLLIDHLDRLARTVEERRTIRARPRLWIDRAFSISGAGTVVTGTLLDGPIERGDDLELYPQAVAARVRGLHQHEQETDRVVPGSRVAINLVGLERTEVERGMMLGRPGDWRTSNRWLVRLRSARYEDGSTSERGAYHVHFGSGAWPAELRPIPDALDVAVLQLSEAVPAAVGDRFILREVGRQRVVAGGRIIDPSPPRRRTDIADQLGHLEAIEMAEPDEAAEALLRARGSASLADLAAWSRGGAPAAAAGHVAVSAWLAEDLAERAEAAVRSFHEMHPLRPGIPRAQLARKLGVDLGLLGALLEQWSLVDDGPTVADPTFSGPETASLDEEWEQLRAALTSDGLSVPRIRDLDVDVEVLHVFLREERLVRISDDFAYLASQLDSIIDAVRGFDHPFSVADFRDALELSRKYAVPLLEYLDTTGITVREGDLRTVRA